MKINNLTTNAESITVQGGSAVVPVGGSFDFGNSTIVVRGTSYADDGTNIYTINLLAGSVAIESEIHPVYEFEQGMTLAIWIVPVLMVTWFIRKYFARGDAFD